MILVFADAARVSAAVPAGSSAAARAPAGLRGPAGRGEGAVRPRGWRPELQAGAPEQAGHVQGDAQDLLVEGALPEALPGVEAPGAVRQISW